MPPEENGENNKGEDTAKVTWMASEFIHHDKSFGWYFGLLIGTAILAFFVYVLTKDVISAAVIIVAGVVLGAYGSRPPRQLQYTIDSNSLTIGDKQYSFHEFKSFTVIPEGAFSGIIFMPLKRFAPSLTVYYAPDDQEKIMAVLSAILPYEEPRQDPVDNLMRRIRF